MTWMENAGEIFYDPLVYGTFKWTVPNFISLNLNIFVESPWFSFEDDEWRLALRVGDVYVNYAEDEKDNCIGLFFKRRHLNRSTEEFDVVIRLETIKEDPDYENLLNHKWKVKPGVDVEKSKFVPVSDLWESVSSKVFLEFSCTIRKLDSEENNTNDIEKVASDKKNMPEQKGVNRLVQNLEKLLLDGDNSDDVLIIGDQKFPVHRAVLSARSPVFASMFQNTVTDSDVAAIRDCTVEAFRAFLRFVYTGSPDIIASGNVFSLYNTAAKYRVDDLKEQCVEFMKKTLSVDNFCDIIALSLKQDESDLQKAATGFFLRNVRKIVKTAQWKKYIQENPIHCNELYIKALNI